MKVYFAGSIRGGRQDAELYRKVIAALKEKHQVLTEHVGDLSLSTVEDKGDQAIYEQDTAWVTLPQNLESSSINSPAFSTFIAAQMWIAMENFCLPRECVYADKQSGKDFDRPAYN